MKLYKSVPIGEFGEFETEVLSVSDSVDSLKAFGFNYAKENGAKNRMWVSEPIMGDKNIRDVTRWFMHFPDETILTISE